jgi:4-diphosphocytidyl-2-C-methyl-D-erythritol kinase
MTGPIAWPAPAKLNLMLRVVGRRADGYHLLQTVFQFIDLADTLYFEVCDDGRVRRDGGLPGLPEATDLVVRAARLLQRHCAIDRGVTIRYRKRIPHGGGLGGGSSDAATTLVALNRLWGCGLPATQLAGLGLELGADVPIFIHGRAAWAEGVGESLTDIEPQESCYLLLAPAVHVDTGKVFQDPDLTRNSRRITIRDFLAGDAVNDCLPVVRKRYPRVAQAFDWLDKNLDARLTGTGACVFAACADRAQAEELLRGRPDGLAGWVVEGRNRSPLLEVLDSLG